MKTFWLILLSPSIICAMDTTNKPADTLESIDKAVQASSCNQCLSMLKRFSAITQNSKEYTGVVLAQQQRIQKLNKQLDESETKIRRLTIAACISGIVVTGLIVREIVNRNSDLLEKLIKNK